jgi:CRP/FNR family transcriptional regulator
MQAVSQPWVVEGRNPALAVCQGETRVSALKLGCVRPIVPGDVMLAEGQTAGVAILPLSGALQMGKTTSRGRRQIICTVGAGSCDGVCLLNLGDAALTDIRGLQGGEALFLDRETFLSLTHSDAGLASAAWLSAQRCMAHLSGIVEQLSFHKVGERVAAALVDGTEEDGDQVRLTQADLAAAVGTTREVVARSLASLQADGLLRLGRGRIIVLDRVELARRC